MIVYGHNLIKLPLMSVDIHSFVCYSPGNGTKLIQTGLHSTPHRTTRCRHFFSALPERNTPCTWKSGMRLQPPPHGIQKLLTVQLSVCGAKVDQSNGPVAQTPPTKRDKCFLNQMPPVRTIRYATDVTGASKASPSKRQATLALFVLVCALK